MICFGNGKPVIHHQDDRWGQETPYLTTNGYGYVDQQMWTNICAFQEGAQPTTEERAEIDMLRMASPYHNEAQFGERLAGTAFAKRMKAVMMLSGKPCTLWEFNAWAELESDERIRFTAPLGERYLVEWSDWDLRVHRIQKVVVRAYNAVLARLRSGRD